MITDKSIQKIIANGATTFADVCIEYDRNKYEGTAFADLISFLKNYKPN